MQRVPAAGRPARDHRDDDLRHEADEPLHLEDVQAADARAAAAGLGRARSAAASVAGVGVVLVAVATADALVAAGAERPAAVLRARTVAGEQDDADPRVLPGDVERAVELVDGVRAERVAHLGPVERDARDAAVLRHVRGDVGVAIGAGCRHPLVVVEELRDGSACRAPPFFASRHASHERTQVVVEVRAGEAEREQARAAVEELVGDVLVRAAAARSR